MRVRPEARGRGVGRALLQGLIGESPQIGGIEMVTLTVTPGNQAALPHYEGTGFVVYGQQRQAIRLDDRHYHDNQHKVQAL